MKSSISFFIFAFNICTINQSDKDIFLISIFDCFN